MLRNYIKIALRYLWRQKGYSFINIGGLAVGMACCMLIMLFVTDELSYDRFHEKAGQIYRVSVSTYMPDAPPQHYAVSNWLNSQVLQESYPGIEKMTRLAPWSPGVKLENQYYLNDSFFFADSTFFDIFTFPLLEGDPSAALRAPFTLVMTREMEQKYFGDKSGLGESIILGDTLSFMVTGIVSDVPSNSHFTFDFLVSWATFENLRPQTNQYTYILLGEGVSAGMLEAEISDLIMRQPGEQISSWGFRAELGLQPLKDIYLHSDLSFEIGSTGNLQYIYILIAIAVFVLILACINFVNLSTARSVDRAKEVGVRKAVGSGRGQLVALFLSESVLIAFLALLMAIAVAEIALPFFNSVTSRDMTFSAFREPATISGLIGMVFTVGLMAGIYPAVILSRFKPASALKGETLPAGQGINLRHKLVIFQFAVSIVLIIGTLTVFNQLHFMKNQHPGFDKDQVVVLNATGIPDQQMEHQYKTVKHELSQNLSVTAISASNSLPGRNTWIAMVKAEGLSQDDSRRMQIFVTDHDYLKTMDIELVAGRDFSTEFERDAHESVLINEAAAESFGWGSPEEALGKYIYSINNQKLTVVGVIRDYHHQSLRQKIEPMMIIIIPSAFNYFSVQFTTQDIPALLAHLESTWQRIFPGVAFEYFFLDDDFNKQYHAEQQLAGIFGIFTLLAILIACLGLFGLAVFMTQHRTKEIGIRKVLGASVTSIITLLSKDILKLVLIGFLIAIPVAWYAMNRWLEDFAYRVEISWWIIAIAGAIAIAIALLTVSTQSYKAAMMNPVKSLRSE